MQIGPPASVFLVAGFLQFQVIKHPERNVILSLFVGVHLRIQPANLGKSV